MSCATYQIYRFPFHRITLLFFFRTAIIPLKYSFIYSKKAIHQKMYGFLSWRRPIFPGSFPPSIFGTAELNFCVRDGNRWDLSVINTSHIGDPCGNRTRVTGVRGRCLDRLTNGPFRREFASHLFGAPSGTRTRDPLIKSQLLYQLS